MKHHAAIARGLLLALVPIHAYASEPASHELTVPTTAGEQIVVEWTGTALAGNHGSANTCPPAGADDMHDIVLTVPEGAYDELTVTAAFHIEWERGEPAPGGLYTDPDLVLTITRDGLEEGSSDGGEPEENVTLDNPAAGTLTAIVCPFAASAPTDYRGRLTLTAIGPATCVDAPTKAVSAAPAGSDGLQSPTELLRGLPNLDQFLIETSQRSLAPAPAYQGRHLNTQYDASLGRPTFLWARTDVDAPAVGALASERDRLIAVARAHLRSEAKALRLDAASIDAAEVSDAGFNGNGPAIVRFRQRVNGLQVHHRQLNVLIDRDFRPVAVSGYFADGADQARQALPRFDRGAHEAIAAAWADLGGVLDANALQLRETRGDYRHYAAPVLSGSHAFERDPRVRAVYYPRADRLEPAWYVELFAVARANGQLIAWAHVISAETGAVLHRDNLVADAAYSYRVFADEDASVTPMDSPLGNGYTPFPAEDPLAQLTRVSADTALITIESGPISTGDPWLPDGATVTVGNNVEACLDRVDNPASGIISNPLNTCDPELGDEYGQANGPNSFDYPITATDDPAGADAAQAAVVNLFYMVNWLHDWWYDHGFDEEAGNAQADNYGRGGADGDPIRAQGQDASGRNNANMATPSDGSSPTMQQYLFDGEIIGEVRQLSPIDSGPLRFVPAGFGPQQFDVTANLVLANDGVGASNTDGCGVDGAGLASSPPPPQASLSGNIALIDRGNCNFTTKAQFALSSGAVGMIVVNNTDGEPIAMGNGDIPVNAGASPTDPAYQIASVMIRKADGQDLKDQLPGAVEMHMQRDPSPDLDGTFDNQIIAHEFFHYVHHRLTDSSNQQARAMSEGWGDINGWMFSARPDDTLLRGNEQWQGAYQLAGFVAKNFYAGIRRAPYSTSFEHNAFTFKHISDGEPTPDGGPGTSNSAVHSSGEIWANMMWECYAGILNDPRHSFAEAQRRMKDYIIGGFKMTPPDATYTEARDAVLSVVLASDFQDFERCSAGFAKRGNGLAAVPPARSSATHEGVVEDYTPFVCGAKAPGTPAAGGESKYGGFGGLTLLVLVLFAGLRRRG